MSKTSRPYDLVRHLAATRKRDFCAGCGLYFAVNGSHRGDCTSTTKDNQ